MCRRSKRAAFRTCSLAAARFTTAPRSRRCAPRWRRSNGRTTNFPFSRRCGDRSSRSATKSCSTTAIVSGASILFIFRRTCPPKLAERSDGVRLMTVHKAKGLEFPVVILVDITAKLHRVSASRYLDARRELCAIQLAGCSPKDLIDHEQDELRRDAAEGARLAYVAA